MAKILIADDAEFLRVRITKMISGDGFEVFQAENGRIAVDTYKEIHPDVVLMDIELPLLSGVEVTRRAREAGLKIPVIALSAHATEDYMQVANEAGCDLYLTKPIDRQELLRAILECVSK